MNDQLKEILVDQNYSCLTTEKDSEWVFEGWLCHIDRIIELSSHVPKDEGGVNFFPYYIVNLIFPLIDAVSMNLFNKGMRSYLRDIQSIRGDVGFSEEAIELMIKKYRDGFLHYFHPLYLEGSKGGLRSLYGSSSSFGNFIFSPTEKVLLVDQDNQWVELKIDRLVALIRDDLILRKKDYEGQKIDFIVGQRMEI